MGMILRIASSRIVGQGDIVGRSGYFSLNLSANSVMRGRLDARRTLKSLVADLRENRHDQSVFSIMSKIRDVEIFPYSFICESVENPIWALRDKKIKLKYRYSFKRFCRKIKEWACERLK